jgi:hypothetical protein
VCGTHQGVDGACGSVLWSNTTLKGGIESVSKSSMWWCDMYGRQSSVWALINFFYPHSFLSLLLTKVLVSYHLFFISNLISILLIIIHIVFVYLIWLIVFFIFHVKFGPYYFDNSFSFYYIFLNSSLSICFKFIFMSNLVYIVVVCFVLNVFLLYFFQFNTLTSFLLRIFLCCFFSFYGVSLCLMARNHRFWRLTHIDFDFLRCFYKIYLFLILFFNI